MKWVKTETKHKLVWDGDPRPEVHDRRLKSIQESYFTCRFCKTPNVCPIEGVVCEDCLHKEEYKKTQPKIQDRVRAKTFKDAIAFGHDTETGKPIALDKQGKRIDPRETVYTQKKDPFGWRATGKKIKDPYYGREEANN